MDPLGSCYQILLFIVHMIMFCGIIHQEKKDFARGGSENKDRSEKRTSTYPDLLYSMYNCMFIFAISMFCIFGKHVYKM